MARKPAAERNSATIARAGKRKWGYDVGQVDAFLERAHTLYEDDEPKMSQEDIQNVSFALEKDGYVISQVDAALNRLEKAVVDKQTQWDVTHFGRVAWRAATEQLAHSLYGRADRPEKNRFEPGASRHPSYDRKQVDRLVNQVIGKIKRELGESKESESDAVRKIDAELTSTRVSNIIFTQRIGKRGYSERQVDAYLNRAIQVLARLESFARLESALFQSGGASVPASQPAATETVATPAQPAPVFPVSSGSGAPVAPVAPSGSEPLTVAASVAAPIITPATPAPVAAAPMAPVVDEVREEQKRKRDDSFTNLREAETEIFSGMADTAPAADTPAAAVAGSLNGLMNSAVENAAVESQTPAQTPVQAPASAPLFPTNAQYATASVNETPTTAIPRPVEPAAPQFTFDATASTPPSFPTQSQLQPVSSPEQHTQYAAPVQPVQSAPAAYTASAYPSYPVYDAAPVSEEPGETHHGRHTSYLPIESGVVGTTPVESTFTPHTPSVSTPAAATASTQTPASNPASTGTSADSTNAASAPDDYFSTLLDTSSIPAVDFHIPNLTFPSPDDDKETR
ncbi:DivIVA domain-containing protein [Bifidobacterium tissieri]|uniref:DivIVA domain-containing protein n=1 Tax=Bifidobacterium tissieri TaxID=1630162 RepID=A0A5M9ZX85_9BIFI|nr:DivIVA domain-containing protein [Bifidobacterium tissieri]KAA8832155.1 DivIVA domain-containing protein [Bifidobacterium tissieri]KAA8832231.1 DivIVA domain-containing protein [Bifidobacterium tissieri]